jgi:hypothetical protein
MQATAFSAVSILGMEVEHGTWNSDLSNQNTSANQSAQLTGRRPRNNPQLGVFLGQAPQQPGG